MLKLLKLKSLTTIVLLSCSISSYANSIHIPFTGEEDSTKIAYSDLRIVNSKLIELKYTKEENSKLYSIIANDSIIISNYKLSNNVYATKLKKAKTHRIISISAITALITGLIVAIIK